MASHGAAMLLWLLVASLYSKVVGGMKQALQCCGCGFVLHCSADCLAAGMYVSVSQIESLKLRPSVHANLHCKLLLPLLLLPLLLLLLSYCRYHGAQGDCNKAADWRECDRWG